MLATSLLPNPFEFMQTAKPDYLPSPIWEKLQHDISMFRTWHLRYCDALLFGEESPRLFKLLARKPNKTEVASGARIWTDGDYVSWLETHNWIFAFYIDHDKYGAYHKIKSKLLDAADQARKLAGTLRELYALNGEFDVLPIELKNLAFAYQRAVFVNHDQGGMAKQLDELVDQEEISAADRPLVQEIYIHGQRGHLPTMADLVDVVDNEITSCQSRFESEGQFGFSIGNYTPDTLVARYVALFDSGLESDRFPDVSKVPRISHEAMSLQCSLVFPDEEIPKDRIIDIRKRIKKANLPVQ